MNCKGKTEELVAYISATGAGALLLSVVTPVIMWTDDRGTSLVPGIQFEGSLVSILATPIDVIGFFASGGGTTIDSPLAGGDGYGAAVGSTLELTPTPTAVPTLPSIKEETGNTDTNSGPENP